MVAAAESSVPAMDEWLLLLPLLLLLLLLRTLSGESDLSADMVAVPNFLAHGGVS